MSVAGPTLESMVQALVRDAIREVVREELASRGEHRRNLGASQGADGYVSVAKAARIADVAPGTVRAWIRAGRLTARRAGRVLRVSRAELEQFMRGEATGPSGAAVQRRASQLFGQRKPLPGRSV